MMILRMKLNTEEEGSIINPFGYQHISLSKYNIDTIHEVFIDYHCNPSPVTSFKRNIKFMYYEDTKELILMEEISGDFKINFSSVSQERELKLNEILK